MDSDQGADASDDANRFVDPDAKAAQIAARVAEAQMKKAEAKQKQVMEKMEAEQKQKKDEAERAAKIAAGEVVDEVD